MLKKGMAILCALVMLHTSAACAQESTLDDLIASMAGTAAKNVQLGGSDLDMYSATVLPADFSRMPDSFDLRDQGYVPEIRSQGNWGTCWGFAIIGASEISILSELGLAVDEYAEKNGKEMNLSEKHLAWFGNSHLPALEDYPEGEYVFPGLESQAGEGIYSVLEEKQGTNSRYNSGGFMAYGSSLFSSGTGPVTEEMYPYLAADGSHSTAEDWSLPEEGRFAISMELENSSILPSPAAQDADGNYVYNPYGTYTIKREVLNGRAVTIAYHADRSMDPDAQKNTLRDLYRQSGFVFEDEAFDSLFTYHFMGERETDMTPSAKLLMLQIVMAQGGMSLEEVHEVTAKMTAEEIAEKIAQFYAPPAEAEVSAEAEAEAEAKALEAEKRAKAAELGFDYDAYLAEMEQVEESSQLKYVNTDTYAQYTSTTQAAANHAVTIIGWDDHYPASNFLADHQPPADGAWIVRNSWGKDYGNEGCFYLSYYDKTIMAPESFDFVTQYPAETPKQVNLSALDYMPTVAYMPARTENAVSYGSIFDSAPSDTVLRYISVLTADLNAEVTADVYLLNEDAALPTDGVLLDRVVSTHLYGGYHRIQLNHDFIIPKDAKIGVVITQRVPHNDGTLYSVPYSSSANRKYLETFNFFAHELSQLTTYAEGRINQGESWLLADGQWHDWADVIAKLQEENIAATYMSYDNPGIKVYSYMLDEVESMHRFEQSVAFNGVKMHQCSDCSYALIEQ